MALVGWPVVNFASDWRNIDSHYSGGATERTAWAIPRYKYTFLAQFQINANVFSLNPQTDLYNYWSNGRLYGQLKAFDFPKTSFKVEKMRSYNKWRNVPTMMEYTPFSMTFHDDATSMVIAMWKEYLNFYSETGNIGYSSDTPTASDQTAAFTINEYMVGENSRLYMSTRQSLGMKMKPASGRHFFDAIILYDFGTEPDSVNIYTIHRPTVTSFEHDAYDEEDRAGKMTMTWQLEYEGLYFILGQNVDTVRYVLEQQLGDDGTPTGEYSIGHANMVQQTVAASALQSTSNSFLSAPSVSNQFLTTLPSPDQPVDPAAAAELQQELNAEQPIIAPAGSALAQQLDSTPGAFSAGGYSFGPTYYANSTQSAAVNTATLINNPTGVQGSGDSGSGSSQQIDPTAAAELQSELAQEQADNVNQSISNAQATLGALQ